MGRVLEMDATLCFTFLFRRESPVFEAGMRGEKREVKQAFPPDLVRLILEVLNNNVVSRGPRCLD